MPILPLPILPISGLSASEPAGAHMGVSLPEAAELTDFAGLFESFVLEAQAEKEPSPEALLGEALPRAEVSRDASQSVELSESSLAKAEAAPPLEAGVNAPAVPSVPAPTAQGAYDAAERRPDEPSAPRSHETFAELKAVDASTHEFGALSVPAERAVQARASRSKHALVAASAPVQQGLRSAELADSPQPAKANATDPLGAAFALAVTPVAQPEGAAFALAVTPVAQPEGAASDLAALRALALERPSAMLSDRPVLLADKTPPASPEAAQLPVPRQPVQIPAASPSAPHFGQAPKNPAPKNPLSLKASTVKAAPVEAQGNVGSQMSLAPQTNSAAPVMAAQPAAAPKIAAVQATPEVPIETQLDESEIALSSTGGVRYVAQLSADAGPTAQLNESKAFVIVREALAELQVSKEREIEVQLSPKTLGRLRFVMQLHEGQMVVQVFAERPETLEAMRRQIEAFSAALNAEGFGSARFEFGNASPEHSSSGEDGSQPPSTPNPSEASEAEAPAEIATRAWRLSSAQLDIRI